MAQMGNDFCSSKAVVKVNGMKVLVPSLQLTHKRQPDCIDWTPLSCPRVGPYDCPWNHGHPCFTDPNHKKLLIAEGRNLKLTEMSLSLL